MLTIAVNSQNLIVKFV